MSKIIEKCPVCSTPGYTVGKTTQYFESETDQLRAEITRLQADRAKLVEALTYLHSNGVFMTVQEGSTYIEAVLKEVEGEE